MKRITEKPWFGKKIIGWGARPLTWQGYVITILFLFMCIVDFSYFRRSLVGIVFFIVTLVLFYIVIRLTSDASTS